MSQNTAIRTAYKSAVMGYKPWHNHTSWQSTGHDSFWQIIDGGLRNGIFDLDTASQLFGETPATIQKWAEGKGLPARKNRIKVWKVIKNILQ